MSRISTHWAKHIKDDEESEKFKKVVYGSKTALDRLSDIIDEYIKDLDIHQANFDNPNWVYRQASLIGERKALEKIKRLINI